MRSLRLEHRRADRHGKSTLAVEPKIPDRPRVNSAREWLEFGDDFHRPFFRRAGDRPAGEAGPERLDMRYLVAQTPLDRGDKMEDLLVGFEVQKLGNPHAAVFAHLPEIVALEIGDHDQFRGLLRRGFQFLGAEPVTVRIGLARPRALDRAGEDLAVRHLQETLRRGGNDLRAAVVEVGRIRRRRETA